MVKNEEKLRKTGNRKPPKQGAAALDPQPKPETGNRKPPRQGAAAGTPSRTRKPETGNRKRKWGKMGKNEKNAEK